MTALTAPRPQITPDKLRRKQFTLTSGTIAYHGGTAAVVRGTGKVVPATGAAGQVVIGKFVETVDASATGFNADAPVTVELPEEITLEKFVNGATTDAVAAANLLDTVYALDDQTVTVVPNGSPVGIFWGFDGNNRVQVQLFNGIGSVGQPGAVKGLAFATGDLALTALQAMHGAVVDVPSTSTASTITLPVSGVKDGTEVVFVADGTKNGHTVTYRYGTTAISAALTASKIHRAVATKMGSIWSINTTVSP